MINKHKFAKPKVGKQRITRDWTGPELKYLKYNYGMIPTKEIMKALNRSARSIYGMAFDMGLTSNKTSRPSKIKHCRVTIRHLVNLGYGARQIAEKLNTNQRHIRWIVQTEFEDSMAEKLRQNGRDQYRKYRKEEAQKRAEERKREEARKRAEARNE